MRSKPIGRWCCMAWLILCAPFSAHGEGATESALKAAFLYYFVLYTQWPEVPDSYNLCLLGTSSFRSAMEPIARKEIGGRPLRIEFLGNGEIPANCHLLYIADSEHARLPEIIGRINGKPVLTVAESGSYAAGLVMLRISRDNGVLVFEANQSAARAAGLHFSAKLLRLAHNVL